MHKHKQKKEKSSEWEEFYSFRNNVQILSSHKFIIAFSCESNCPLVIFLSFLIGQEGGKPKAIRINFRNLPILIIWITRDEQHCAVISWEPTQNKFSENKLLHKLLIDYIIRNFSDLRAIQTKKVEFEYFLKVKPFVIVLRNPSSTLQKVRVATYAFIKDVYTLNKSNLLFQKTHANHQNPINCWC